MRHRLLASTLVAALTLAACSSSDSGTATDTDSTTPDSTNPDTPPTTVAPTVETSSPATAPPTAPPTTAPSAADAEALAWAPCDEFDDPALVCATITVPLEHAEPEGPTIDIALVKRPATGERIGPMLFNPGGPGASGVDLVAAIGAVPSMAPLNERFDLVGFDPRGVARSSGIECVDGATFDQVLLVDPTPETAAEEQAAAELYDTVLEACRQKYGDVLRALSTEETARDMDAIRAALGDEQISFYGISYGTYLGAVYATLFPERVRAMMLDSAFLPDGLGAAEQTRLQFVGFDGALADMLAWCAEDTSCAIHEGDPGARWDALADALDAEPLEADGRPVNLAVLGSAAAGALYSEATWPVLAAGIAAAEEGDGSILQQLADGFAERRPDGTYGTLTTGNLVITCASGIAGEPPADPAAAVEEIRQAAPRFGRFVSPFAFTEDCGALLGDPAPVAPAIRYAGDGPIVVVGGTQDPATPYEYATRLVDALGPASHLVTYDGPGHGASIGTPCLEQVARDLLVSLRVPAADTTCTPPEVADAPSWWGELPALPDVQETFTPNAGFLGGLGLDPSQQYVDGAVSSATPDEIHDALTGALVGWTVTEMDTGEPGMRRTTFELEGRRVELITLSQELLESLGETIEGTVVVIAGS